MKEFVVALLDDETRDCLDAQVVTAASAAEARDMARDWWTSASERNIQVIERQY